MTIDQTQPQAPLRAQLLEQFMKNCPFDGWTEKNLANAARSVDISEFELHRLLPERLAGLARIYVDTLNEKHRRAFEKLDISALKLREKVFEALMTRLKIMSENKEVVRAFAAYSMNPAHIGSLTHSVSSAADLIWRMVGDKSVDVSFFTKRLSLGAIYSKTLLFWLSDDSDDMAETRGFLRRQIDYLMEFQKIKNKIKNAF